MSKNKSKNKNKNKNEEEISQIIKNMEVDIPESLMPERIEERLQLNQERQRMKQESTKKRRIFYGSAGTLAAAAALALILMPVEQMKKAQNTGAAQKMESVENIDGAEESNQEISGIPTASYHDVYQYINAYYEENKRSIGLYGATSDADGVISDLIVQETAAAMGAIPGNGMPVKEMEEMEAELSYSETNVQVEGVDESNVIKTDGSYLYLLNQSKTAVQILKVEGERLTLASEILLPSSDEEESRLNYSELYLEKDRLIVIGSSVSYTPYQLGVESGTIFRRTKEVDYSITSNKTCIRIYDVADRTNPVLLSALSQDGSYQNSRKTDGYLYVYSIYQAAPYVEEEDREYYIPCIQEVLIPEDRIYMPMISQNTTSYMVMTGLDISSPEEFASASAVLANWSEFYVSKNNIYMVGYQEYKKENTYSTSKLLKFSYQEGVITAKAEVEIPGMIDSSYSMDEYDGYLRLVSNVRHYEYRTISGEGQETYESIDYVKTVNGLYIYDENLNQVSSIEDIAPEEYIKSARFMGDIGYFVTFRQTDPLFSVDLSAPYHPQILGELKISGFSEYLHPYGENLLLGIGYEADIHTGGTEGIKLSMFDVSDPTDVKEFHKLVLPNMEHSVAFYNPKLVLASAAKNIIGFQMSGLVESGKDVYWGNYYKTFSYDKDDGFSEEITNRSPDGGNWYVDSQAVYIGDYLYILESNYRFSIYDLNTNEYMSTWDAN